MKTFEVNIAITVFASVQVKARNAEDAETQAEQSSIDYRDLKLRDGASKPQFVFQGESQEVHL